MYRQDLEFEKLVVPEPIGLASHRLDLVVCPLQRTCADRVVVVGQETRAMFLECLGHLEQYVDSRRLGAPDPVADAAR